MDKYRRNIRIEVFLMGFALIVIFALIAFSGT